MKADEYTGCTRDAVAGLQVRIKEALTTVKAAAEALQGLVTDGLPSSRERQVLMESALRAIESLAQLEVYERRLAPCDCAKPEPLVRGGRAKADASRRLAKVSARIVGLLRSHPKGLTGGELEALLSPLGVTSLEGSAGVLDLWEQNQIVLTEDRRYRLLSVQR